NDKVQQRDRPERRNASGRRHAGPLCCNDWLAGARKPRPKEMYQTVLVPVIVRVEGDDLVHCESERQRKRNGNEPDERGPRAPAQGGASARWGRADRWATLGGLPQPPGRGGACSPGAAASSDGVGEVSW